MENITLYRKYRPQNFSEIYGQEHISRAIKNSLDNNRISHAYLFNGPRGVGKTTIARLISKGVNCISGITSSPCDNCENCLEIKKGIFQDIIEIDAASNRGIDEIRDLKEKTSYLPVKGRKKVYIIDEVHMLTKEAFNALLKILEEPPLHIIFILATTEIEKIPDTVISRCQRYDFKTISEIDIVEMLKSVAIKENIKIDTESLELIYQKSEGSARDSFSIFEQVISNYLNTDEINVEMTEKSLGIVSKIYHQKYLDLILNENKKGLLEFIDDIWNQGIQIDVFLKDFSKYLKKQDIDILLKVKVISTILDILVKFKNEEDKRLLSYLIINKLFVKNTSLKKIDILDENINKKNNSNTFNWDEFINYLKEKGHLMYYNLLSSSNAKLIDNNMIITFSENSNFNKNLINNTKIVDFIEKEFNKKYNMQINILKVKIKENIEEDELIRQKIKKLFNAIEI